MHTNKKANHLIDEEPPYLIQHAVLVIIAMFKKVFNNKIRANNDSFL